MATDPSKFRQRRNEGAAQFAAARFPGDVQTQAKFLKRFDSESKRAAGRIRHAAQTIATAVGKKLD